MAGEARVGSGRACLALGGLRRGVVAQHPCHHCMRRDREFVFRVAVMGLTVQAHYERLDALTAGHTGLQEL